MRIEIKKKMHQRRHKRARAKVFGTAKRPRLFVFRSSKHLYAQLIDDEKNQTILTASDRELKKSKETKKEIPSTEKKEKMTRKREISYQVGQLIAQKALKNKIEKVVFDRGGYKYHGRVKALAEGAREGGLKF